MINHIKDFFFITGLHAFFNEFPQIADLPFCECRCFGSIRLIPVVIQWIIILTEVVMEENTGCKSYMLILYGRIVIRYQLSIRPCLIRRMNYFSHRTSGVSLHQCLRIIYCFQLAPLLQFHNDHARLSTRVIS